MHAGHQVYPNAVIVRLPSLGYHLPTGVSPGWGGCHIRSLGSFGVTGALVSPELWCHPSFGVTRPTLGHCVQVSVQ
jgi:hypothetical protein